MSKSDTPRTDAVRLPSEVLLPASEKHLGSAVRGAIQILGDHARQLEREIIAIRNAIATDRCDGDSDYAAGVNAACERHLNMIDAILSGEPK